MKEDSIGRRRRVPGGITRQPAGRGMMSGAGVRAAVALLGWVTMVGCAKSPTVIVTEVKADETVPPVLQLRTTVTRPSEPPETVVNMYSSLLRGDATDRPAPYRFPFLMQIPAPPAWQGPVQVTVEGLDWDTNAVNAMGTTLADVVAEQVTHATITLTAVAIGGGPDGGADASEEDVGGGDDDAAPIDDASATDDLVPTTDPPVTM